MTLLITGASGAGKSTLALQMLERLPSYEGWPLDYTKAWQDYRLAYQHDWALYRTFTPERDKVQSLQCWKAIIECLTSCHGERSIMEGAQILRHLDKLTNHDIILVDTPKEVCCMQTVKRAANKLRKLNEVADNAWLNERFNRARRVYELWEPHIEKARTMKNVICVKPGEADKVLQVIEEGQLAIA